MPRSLCYDINSKYRELSAYPGTGAFGVSFVSPACPPLIFPSAPFDYGTGDLEVCASEGLLKLYWRLKVSAANFVCIPGVYEGAYMSLVQPQMPQPVWGKVIRAGAMEGGAGMFLIEPTVLPPNGVPAPIPQYPPVPCPPVDPVAELYAQLKNGQASYSLRRTLPKAEGVITQQPLPPGTITVSPFPAGLGSYTPPVSPPPCQCPRDRRRPRCCSGLPAYKVMIYPQFECNPLNVGVGKVYDLVAWSSTESTFVLDPPFADTPVQPGCWSSWRWELWQQGSTAAASRSSFAGPKRWQCGSGTGLGTVRLRDLFLPCSSRITGLGYLCDLPYIYVQLWPEHGNQCNESFVSFAPVETTQRLTYKVAVNAPGPRVKLWQQLPAGYDSPTASSPQPWTFLHVWVLAPDGTPLNFEPLMPNAYPESGPDQYSQVILTIDATWLD